MYFPDVENATDVTYGVFYFITGFGGFAPPNLYRDYMARVASHGYVVLGSWPLVTGEGFCGIDFSPEAHLANIEYVSIASMFYSSIRYQLIVKQLSGFIKVCYIYVLVN